MSITIASKSCQSSNTAVEIRTITEDEDIFNNPKIAQNLKELTTYINCLNASPYQMMSNTFIALNPHTLDKNEVGEKEARDIKIWWDTQDTRKSIAKFILTENHKVGEGNWCNGCFGSRWIDRKINGRRCRFAFYTQKEMSPDTMRGKKYALIIDPTN